MGAGGSNDLPRLLVTGFEAFPGAPVNPTEALVARLRAAPPAIAGIGAFRAECLPVDYQAIGPRLSAIGKAFAPDIVVHFGLAAGCRGFRLERQGRNRFIGARPDNCGFAPPDGPICPGPPVVPATLPFEAIYAALGAADLPVELSDDAGGYLCNAAMTLSLAGACDGFAPTRCGFVHVPMVGEGTPLSRAQFDRGVAIILAVILGAK